MSSASTLIGLGHPQIFNKETVIEGKQTEIECVAINGQTFSLTRGLLTILGLEDEWYEDVRDPEEVVSILRRNPDIKADLFTFWQRIPDVIPRYPYHIEWDELAVLPIKTYDFWWNRQITSNARKLIRRCPKKGVVIKETTYDDDFIRGMTTIFNESPVRQGRRFWHYGKDFETVKRQFSRTIHRERLISAYYNDEMIGFVFLRNEGHYGVLGQIISSLKHRNKYVNDALVAKAVEVCERSGLRYLVYGSWDDNSLTEFKRRCGCECVKVPRYYVPLTRKGRWGLQLGAHRGWKRMVPRPLAIPLKRLRSTWLQLVAPRALGQWPDE